MYNSLNEMNLCYRNFLSAIFGMASSSFSLDSINIVLRHPLKGFLSNFGNRKKTSMAMYGHKSNWGIIMVFVIAVVEFSRIVSPLVRFLLRNTLLKSFQIIFYIDCVTQWQTNPEIKKKFLCDPKIMSPRLVTF